MIIKQFIGGVVYNKQGQKIGKWVELDDEFQNQSQVTYSGQYMNGQKVGLWDTIYKRMDQLDRMQLFILIKHQNRGGRSYVYKKEGFDLNFKKVGIWIELTDGFLGKSWVIQCGEYKNCRKIDKWVNFWRKNQYQQFKQIIPNSSDGSYDDKPEDQDTQVSIKIGQNLEIRLFSSVNIIEVNKLIDGMRFFKMNRCIIKIKLQLFKKCQIKIEAKDLMMTNQEMKLSLEIGQNLVKDFKCIFFWLILYIFRDREVTYNGEYQNESRIGKGYFLLRRIDVKQIIQNIYLTQKLEIKTVGVNLMIKNKDRIILQVKQNREMD
ncbi:unnamed protein product [Paramecium pentaurelia]|uniref:Uncharacterized protein n=1 Tax=Paramecium pentaurelia TaxID=43138 RepID=A0A8S1X892_9CILI|nr:unnamed protein product [Paramecium pentaurelia]